MSESFQISKTESDRMRRGAILPLFLILPLAAMFGLDSSKSQPTHFLMTFTIGLAFSAIFVSMSWHGVKRRIAESSGTRLLVESGKLTWISGIGESSLDLNAVTAVTVQQWRGEVRSVVLRHTDGRQTELRGYERMSELVGHLREQLRPEIFEVNKWLYI